MLHHILAQVSIHLNQKTPPTLTLVFLIIPPLISVCFSCCCFALFFFICYGDGSQGSFAVPVCNVFSSKTLAFSHIRHFAGTYPGIFRRWSASTADPPISHPSIRSWRQVWFHDCIRIPVGVPTHVFPCPNIGTLDG